MGQVHTLKNGLRVFVDPMPSLETVALGVWSHAGSVNETDGEHGIAHLLEHMAFKGTTTRSARDIAEDIENVGGYLNAATSHQRTGYYVRLLKDDIALGLEILSDILLRPTFVYAELEKEKDVVVQEIGEAADTPDDVVFELLQSATWGSHPLARPILGTPKSVRAQTPDSLRAFMNRWYYPENMIVAVAGNVNVKDFIVRANDAFGDIESGEAVVSIAPAEFAGGVSHDAREIEQTHLAIALPGVSVRDDDYFATRVFVDVLGGGMSSRLFQKIREERGLAYSVYAFADGYEECGLIGAYVGADHGQIVSAAGLIRDEIEAMTADVGQAEVDRARAMLRSSMMMSLENPSSRIEAGAGQLFVYDRIIPIAELSARLDAVSVNDVQRCVVRALSGGLSISVVGAGDVEAVAGVFR